MSVYMYVYVCVCIYKLILKNLRIISILKYSINMFSLRGNMFIEYNELEQSDINDINNRNFITKFHYLEKIGLCNYFMQY